MGKLSAREVSFSTILKYNTKKDLACVLNCRRCIVFVGNAVAALVEILEVAPAAVSVCCLDQPIQAKRDGTIDGPISRWQLWQERQHTFQHTVVVHRVLLNRVQRTACFAARRMRAPTESTPDHCVRIQLPHYRGFPKKYDFLPP